MRTIQSVGDAQRLALATGAELEVNGARFNAKRAQVRPAAPAPAAPAAPAAPPPPPATYTRQEVDAMLAKQAAQFHERIARLTGSLSSNQARTPVSPAQWDFDIVENSEGAIVHVTARARP